MAESLYIHIPFCSSICKYCDFVKLLYKDEWAFAYIRALLKELEEKYAHKRFSTIYIGGGTPNCLPFSLLEELLAAVEIHLSEGGEFTIECNPEFVDEELLFMMANHHVNRISMGMESADEKLLEKMGRHHCFEDVLKAVEVCKKIGIYNISVDMIYALPEEDEKMLRKDIDALLSLNVPHLSAYSYIQEDRSIWTIQGVKEADEDIQGAYYMIIEEALLKAGYGHYEISSYAKKGYQSRHNKTYWKDEEYAALGLGASGYEDGVRYKNTASLPLYLKGQTIQEKETVTKEDDVHYFLMTNLRLKEGFAYEDFMRRFDYDIRTEKGKIIEKLIQQGMVEPTAARLSPTYKGMRLLDAMLLDLF